MSESNKIVKYSLITMSVLFIGIMLGVPLISIIVESLRKGMEGYTKAISDPYTVKAFWLTVMAMLIATTANTIFGLFCAWTITKFTFRGKNMLATLVDLPFAVSPIIAGLVFILTFGRIGFLDDFLTQNNMKVVFAVPGIILATIFVTLPFVARELIPLMTSQGTEEEEAAAMLGAKGFTIFRKVTLPNIKWALLYGIVLCMARAMGEFGAVSVVSGHIRGKTNTLPLHVEILYNEYQFAASFAVSSILVILAVVILIIRNIVEYKGRHSQRE